MTASVAIKYAQRMVRKFGLVPPIDVESLIRERAELTYADIPMKGVDGVCLYLKTPGKTTKVIVNSNNPPLRQRFTLAHELGHIIIPWHTGSIVDHLDPDEGYAVQDYLELENEANLFAGEILVPSDWIVALLKDTENLAEIHRTISNECQVSSHAGAVRLAQILPKNVVFAAERSGTVEFSGRTPGTLASSLAWGTEFDPHAYSYADSHFSIKVGKRTCHWWVLPNTVSVKIEDQRAWREILDSIVDSFDLPEGDARDLKNSINGVVAFANGRARRSDDYSVDSVISACMQRFSDRPEFKSFVQHTDFEAFIAKKAESLVNK